MAFYDFLKATLYHCPVSCAEHGPFSLGRVYGFFFNAPFLDTCVC